MASALAYIVVGGGFQDGEGNLLTEGSVIFQLSADATDNATGTQQICSGQKLPVPLDDDGNIVVDPVYYIVPNDLITSNVSGIGDTFYWITAEDENGQTVYGPNAILLLAANAFSFLNVTELTTDGTTTTFTLDEVPVTDSLIVYKNGLAVTPGIGYTLSGATLTFTAAPAASDEVLAADYVGISPFNPVFNQDSFSSGSTTYTLSETPVTGTLKLFMSGLLQTPGTSYTISGRVITFSATTVGEVYAVYQTTAGELPSTGQVPAGVLNGVNTVFTMSTSVPVSLYVNGIYQDGSGYSQTGATITFDVAPLSWYSLYAYNDKQQFISLTDIVPSNPA
jgi:hypothetical protein